MQYVTPSELWSEEGTNLEPFDVILSISSEEHNGLGRYGDPLNPNGDISHVSALSKIGRLMFLAVPSGHDCLVFNAHRIYGPIRRQLLHAEWTEVDFIGDDKRIVPSCEESVTEAHTYQPVYVLQSKQWELMNSSEETEVDDDNDDAIDICPINPTFNAALQQFALEHNNGNNASSSLHDEEWIVYTCNCVKSHRCSEHFKNNQFVGSRTYQRPGCSCGGLGDRLNGIMSSLVVAMLTGRSFAIDWKSPCPLEDHWMPHLIHWHSEVWKKKVIGSDSPVVGCMSLFDYPPDNSLFAKHNLTLTMQHHAVVRFSSNVNLLPFLWSNQYHGSAMRTLFGDETARPLFTKQFGCMFHFLFQLTPKLQDTVNQLLVKKEDTQSIGVQIRLGSKWDLDLMEVPSDMNKWTDALQRLIKDGSNYDIFITSDQSHVFQYMASFFAHFPSQVRVIELTSPSDVHLDHVDAAPPSDIDRSLEVNVTSTSNKAPETARCSSSISKMFVDWWVLGECDQILASMSGFGASAIWRVRHNNSWIVHNWNTEMRYWYYTDWQTRTPLGDNGQRVIVEIPSIDGT